MIATSWLGLPWEIVPLLGLLALVAGAAAAGSLALHRSLRQVQQLGAVLPRPQREPSCSACGAPEPYHLPRCEWRER